MPSWGSKKKVNDKVNKHKLKKQLDELRKINADLGNAVNDIESHALSKEEMKHFDEFQKQKRQLNILLDDTRKDVARLEEMKKEKNQVSVRDRVEMNQSTDKKMKQCVQSLQSLQKQLKSDQIRANKKKKNALSEEELARRNQMLMSLAKEISTLAQRNSRSAGKMQNGPSTDGKALLGIDDKVDTSRQDERAKRREERRGRRKGRKEKIEVNTDDFQEVSAQDQMFLDKKDAAYEEQDEVLGEISKGLTEILGISQDINKTLKYQSHLINNVDDQMSKVEVKLDNANDKMKELFEESGGLNTWCPRIICFTLVIAIAGYLVTQVFD